MMEHRESIVVCMTSCNSFVMFTVQGNTIPSPWDVAESFSKWSISEQVKRYVCIEVTLHGDAHGIGRSNWAKGRDPSGSWVQYPNPAVPTAPRHSRWILLTHSTCAF